MPLDYLGSVTLGAAVPTAAVAATSASASLAAQLPGITAQISGMLTVQPPVLTTDLIANLGALATALGTLLAAGVVVIPPSVNLEASADLEVTKGALELSLDAQASVLALFGTAGFYEYFYTGPTNALGSDVSAALSAGLPGSSDPAQQIAGLLLVCSDPASVAALRGLTGVL